MQRRFGVRVFVFLFFWGPLFCGWGVEGKGEGGWWVSGWVGCERWGWGISCPAPPPSPHFLLGGEGLGYEICLSLGLPFLLVLCCFVKVNIFFLFAGSEGCFGGGGGVSLFELVSE